MNEMEEFLNFGAIVKIRKEYDNDLYKFIELMKSVGFLKEYAEQFEQSCCFNTEYNEFSEDKFWYYVKLNKGNTRDTCLEFQWSKGFTWGDRKDYLNYDKDMRVLNIDELIRACNKEELFNMNYEKTIFENELEDKESASELDNFLDFYEWSIVKYPNGEYNIKDEQCNTFDFEENTTFDKVLNRVYFRMLDYFIDEGDIESLIHDGEFEYTKKVYNNYMKTGESLKLLDENDKQQYEKLFNEIVNENIKKDDIEVTNDI